jgi:hypothetical protein
LTHGELAILRFLAAIELIESDLWQQYEELGGVIFGTPNAYQFALQSLNHEIPQYITNTAIDEIGHSNFINALLESEDAESVHLDQFRNLRASSAKGALNVGRMTNLMHLELDNSWYIRYHYRVHPELNVPSARPVRIVNGKGLPSSEADFADPFHICAIAKTTALHLAYMEHVISNVYSSFIQKVKRTTLLKILFGIAGNETAHFLGWIDIARGVLEGGPFETDDAPAYRGQKELAFLASGGPRSLFRGRALRWGNGDCPVNDKGGNYLSNSEPFQSVDPQFDGAVDTILSLIQSGLFVGQSPEFLRELTAIAEDADTAVWQPVE